MDRFEEEARLRRLFDGSAMKGYSIDYEVFDEYQVNGPIYAGDFTDRPNPFFIFGGDEYYPRTFTTKVGTAETMKPRDGYIDGGIILTSGFQITKEMMTDSPMEEYRALSDFIDRMPNLVANEVLPDRMYYVYDAVPVITSMER